MQHYPGLQRLFTLLSIRNILDEMPQNKQEKLKWSVPVSQCFHSC